MGERAFGYVLTGVAVLVAASGARATVLTRTVSANSQGAVALARFDPTLGTLMQATVSATYLSQSGYVSFTPVVGYDHATSGTASLGSLLFALAGTTATTDLGGGYGYFTVNAAGSTTWSAAVDLALLTGTGSMTSGVNIYAPPPGAVTAAPSPKLNYSVTYTYNDGLTGAVPEPATWAMMAGGFALVGLGLRQARRRARHVDAVSEVPTAS